MTDDTTEIIVAEPDETGLVRFDAEAAIERLRGCESLVRFMAEKCSGPQYIVKIQGKSYPKVEWWTTVGGGLGLFPVEIACRRIADDPIVYEATVEVRLRGEVVTRASAICSMAERRWSHADEYAVRSMSTTRATGKAFRIGLSFLAVMAGLEPTPAEEVPPAGFDGPRNPPEPSENDKPAPTKLPKGAAAPGGPGEWITFKEVKVKEGETNGKAWTRYGVNIGGVWYSTFDHKVGEMLQDAAADGLKVHVDTETGKHGIKITAARIESRGGPGAPVDTELPF